MKQANGTTKTTEQVAGKHEIDKEQQRPDTNKARLVSGKAGVEQVVIDLERRQQIGEQAQCPEEGKRGCQRNRQQPVACIRFEHTSIRLT